MSSLESIVLPRGAESIGTALFDGCSNLKFIQVSAYNENYASDGSQGRDEKKRPLLEGLEG